MGKYKKNTYFSKEIKSPFSEKIDNEEIYSEMFNMLQIKENEKINNKSKKFLKWRK